MPEIYTELDLISVIVDAYDLRGGGVETSYKNSKQGIGLLKRNKKCFHAQEMLVLLAQLAYNITGWVQNELAQHSSTIASFGVLRMIPDFFDSRRVKCALFWAKFRSEVLLLITVHR
mgnify:CR=1 FL=1